MKVHEGAQMARRTGRIALVAVLAACSPPPPQAPQHKPSDLLVAADAIINREFNNTQWGVEVFDQTNSRTVYDYNAIRHFIPASNTKLVVTAVAMGTLGPDFRYQTPLFVAGAPGDTAPRGLLIVGQGDPTMSGRFNGGDDFAVVKMLADSLYAKGIRRINGDIVVDASFFTPETVHSTWEIGDLPWYYAAPTGALAIAEGALRMIVRAGAAPGAAPTASFVGADFPMPVVVRANTDTAGAGASIDVDYEAWPDTLVITGRIGLNRADSSWIAIPDQPAFAARALRDAMTRRGITTAGTIRVARDTATARSMRAAFTNQTPVATWSSAPVREIIAGILKPSQNWIAEQLLRTLGARYGGQGSWSSGIRVERRYLIDVARVDSTGFSLRDGSGLSAQNLLSPRATLQLLEHARQSPWGADYRAALPTPGMRGATLSSRLQGLESRLAAKTGTISNVNSLSGYLRTADNRDLTFAIYTNASGRPSAEIRRAIDLLVNSIARDTVTK